MNESDASSEPGLRDNIFRKELQEKRNSPPRAPLALRIGVTGHRTENVDPQTAVRKRPAPDIKAIQATVKEVLEVIRVSFKGVADTNSHLFEITTADTNQFGGGKLRMVSALASGADQWVASEAVNLGFELQAILPFDQQEYLKDFTDKSDADAYLELLGKASAILELDGRVRIDDSGKRKPDSQSYEAVGRALLNQTDLLIAVWDGQDAKGRGGTGQIVREALQNGIPVVWIPWNSPENWKLQNPSWRLLEEVADLSGECDRLSEMVEKLLLPPVENFQSDVESGRSLRNDYFAETQKRGNPHLGMWLLFRNLICGELFRKGGIKMAIDAFSVKDFVSYELYKSEQFWYSKPDAEGNRKSSIDNQLQSWITRNYTFHYAWANGLSMFYGDMHRSAILLNYLLGACAVFLALVCIALGISGKLQTGWIVAELFVILGILILTTRGRKRRWHQRWIDYRTLAEHIRLSRVTILLGGGSQQAIYEGHLSSYGNPSQTWMNWHYRAIERAAGIPQLKITGDYLSACQEIWRDGLVKGQIKYHQAAFNRFKRLDKRLHKTGDNLFIATLLACLIHLVHLWVESDPRFNWIPHNSGRWMTVLCAFLPALGAAFAAIRSHIEVQRLAQRSKAMEESLLKLQAELARIPVSGNDLNSVKLRYHIDRISELMTNEMLDWRVVFQDRPLGLPV